MVVLILTRSGFEDMRPRITPGRDAVWVNGGVLSVAEVGDLRRDGWDLSTFTHSLDLTNLAGDLETIRLHHPGAVIWTEML